MRDAWDGCVDPTRPVHGERPRDRTRHYLLRMVQELDEWGDPLPNHDGPPRKTPNPVQAMKARSFRELHEREEILALPNVWDVPSAKAVSTAGGVRAIATASHSISAMLGYEDGEKMPLETHLDIVERIMSVVKLPVTVDLERGYGDPGELVRRVIEMGAVGANLEDGMGPLQEATDAIEIVLKVAYEENIDFFLNARTDAMLKGYPGASRKDLVKEAVRRGQAFLEVGAPIVFVPGVFAREEIELLVEEFGERKLSLIHIPGKSLPTAELQELGVARVSTGPYTQQVALTALQDAAKEFAQGGVLPPGTRKLN